MYLADLHMHSTVSFDGKNTRREMAQAAAQAGLSTICFTDHYDMINEKSEFIPTYDWAPARAQHRDIGNCSIEVLYGLELGNATADFEAGERVLVEPGLDFVIGSIHNSSRETGGTDYYDVNYARTPELVRIHMADYLAQLTRLVNRGCFDTLGHLPYPLRYMQERDGVAVSLGDYPEEVRALLRSAAEQGKAIEVNSNRARSSLAEYVPLLKQFRALGGEAVTVGADAHACAHVGLGLQQAYGLIADCGFRYTAVYRKRKPEFIKL